MPKIEFAKHSFECEIGDNLRQLLLAEGLPLYQGIAKHIHCRGLGTCGTCAVHVQGEVTPPTMIEAWRLGFPPHQAGSGLRLACQCRVRGDLIVTKYPGLWGQKVTLPSSE